jgi:RHS repeat-associated protein
LINERQILGGASTTSFYGFDGHGSVRFLTSSTGAVTDTYDYDAFGNLISSTGSTPNNYLFAGEQFDPLLGIYYNRARYYDQRQGRFWTMDTWEGDPESPPSSHKYLYSSVDPVDRMDPSGQEDIASITAAVSIATTLNNIQFMNGTAVMDQLQFGGNAGFKSLLLGAGFIVGSIVVFKIVGGTVKYLNAAAYSLNSKIALSRFSRAAEYGILPGKLLDKLVPVGSGLHKHHLIEQRFAPRLGIAAGDIPAIALTPGEHQVFTNAWRDAIGYITDKNPINTATATLDNIWAAAQDVYASYPELLEYVRIFLHR